MNERKEPRGKQPSFQFYPGDWRKDPELRRCSIFARGLLMDLLCVCFESASRGRLCERDGVTPWSDDDILQACGEANEIGRNALAELERKEVLSRDATGCLISRRMVRDAEVSAMRSESGAVGGHKSASKRGSKSQANGEANAKQNASSSSSASSSPSGIDNTNAGEANGNHGPRPTFLTGRSESFNRFLEAYPRRTSPELAWEVWQAKTLQLAEVNKTTAPEIEEMLIRAAAEYALAPAGQPPNSGEDYRPSPGNWLLGHKFEEDRAEWQQANGKQPKGRGKSKKATAEIEDFFAKRGL